MLARVSGVDIGAIGFKFGFKLDTIGKPGGASLAQVITDIVDQAKRDVVLVVDEVQQAITTEEGNVLLLGLKAARDAVNPRPGTPGHFIFLGTGSHRAMVSELTTRRTRAFNGATSIVYPVLDADYVDFVLARLAQDGVPNLPSRVAALAAFRMLGNRPEEMLRALRQLQMHHALGADPDATLAIIASTLRLSVADIELAKLEQIGGLAAVVFERIASTDGDARGIFSLEAAADYGKAIGREVKVDEIQPVVNELMGANLVMRRSHGLYGITDPFVQETWREKQALLSS